MRPSDCRVVLDREFAAASESIHTPVMLWGPPGVGKSQLVAQVATANGVPLVDVRLAQMEPTDLRGIPFRNGDSVVWAAPALLPNAERHGLRGILFLDEITSATPTVTAAAYQLILDRRLGEYEVPAGWAIFAAGNRHGDRGVTYQLPAPLANRFAHYEIEPDLDDWARWAYAQPIDPRLIAFLRFRPDLLFNFDPTRHSVAFPSPRSWAFADRALRKFRDTPHLLAESLQACVGAAAGLAFRAYLDHIDALPDPARVLSGEITALPAKVELQYAVATSIVRHIASLPKAAHAQALNQALVAAHCFAHREIGVMLITDLQHAIDRPLYDLPAFADWAAAVKDLILFDRP